MRLDRPPLSSAGDADLLAASVAATNFCASPAMTAIR